MKLSTPFFSIVMPTFNRGHILHEAVISIQRQTFSDWELLIIDDGSSDATQSQVNELLSDTIIHYLQQPHQGAAKARNHGLQKSIGQYIGYLDSDNLYHRNFLEKAYQALANNPNIDCLYGNLLSELHGTRINRAFSWGDLLEANYIDLNVFIHKRACTEQYGAFDESLTRLIDWDLILRYTQFSNVSYLNTPAAIYREVDDIRITKNAPLEPNRITVLKKFPPQSAIKPRVLYVLWHYPQLTETYAETEIRQLRKFGCEVYVWREVMPVSPYETEIPVYDEPLEDIILMVKPDLIHIHWLGFAKQNEYLLDVLKIPVTVRLHGFDFDYDYILHLLKKDWLRSIYGFPHHQSLFKNSSKFKQLKSSFDSDLFAPCRFKNRKMVFRAVAGLPSKDVPFFLEIAKRLPDFEFIIALGVCNCKEAYIQELLQLAKTINSPAKVMVNVPRDEVARLTKEAGIYLHTVNALGTDHATPLGMPISISEAMATGAYILARNVDVMARYIEDAGALYNDMDEAISCIERTRTWTDAQWSAAFNQSVNRSYTQHADALVLKPVYLDWVEIIRCSALNWQQIKLYQLKLKAAHFARVELFIKVVRRIKYKLRDWGLKRHLQS